MKLEQARIEAQNAVDRSSKEARGTDWDGLVAVLSRDALKALLAHLDKPEVTDG